MTRRVWIDVGSDTKATLNSFYAQSKKITSLSFLDLMVNVIHEREIKYIFELLKQISNFKKLCKRRKKK